MAIVMSFIAAIALCVRALQLPQTVASLADTGMKIVLDAGHGGIDGGVTGKQTGIKESDLNLAITMRLKDVLTDMGFNVVLTRKTEAGLYDSIAKGFKKRDMQKRKEIIEEASPDLVLSIHQNYYPTQNSRGAQVFYLKDSNGEKLALCIQNTLNTLYAETDAKGRKASVGDYFMLKCYDCPSVIIECGFLSNRKDEELLCSEHWQKKLVERIAVGILEYLSNSVV